MTEKVWLASQFASQNFLGCFSKLNLGSKFHAEVAIYSSPSYKIKTSICLEYYYITIIAIQLQQTATQFE